MDKKTPESAPKTSNRLFVVCGIIIAACLLFLQYFRSLSADEKEVWGSDKDQGLVPYQPPSSSSGGQDNQSGSTSETPNQSPTDQGNVLAPPGN